MDLKQCLKEEAGKLIGKVYLLHFDKPYMHARHYLGWAKHLEQRLEHHRAGTGANLLKVITQHGINFEVARIWENEDRNFERRLKNQGGLSRHCPICKKLGIDRDTLRKKKIETVDTTIPIEPIEPAAGPDFAEIEIAAEPGNEEKLMDITEKLEVAGKKSIIAGQKVETSPSEAQIDSGKYKKGHITVHGLSIVIENPKGTTRSGTNADGKKWSNKLYSDYGYIKGFKGKDKDELDIMIGDNHDSEFVYVVNQKKENAKGFDEHKVVLGTNNEKDAKQTYLDNYEKNWLSKQGGSLDGISMTIDQFKDWLEKGDAKSPITDKSLKENFTKDKADPIKDPHQTQPGSGPPAFGLPPSGQGTPKDMWGRKKPKPKHSHKKQTLVAEPESDRGLEKIKEWNKDDAFVSKFMKNGEPAVIYKDKIYTMRNLIGIPQIGQTGHEKIWRELLKQGILTKNEAGKTFGSLDPRPDANKYDEGYMVGKTYFSKLDIGKMWQNYNADTLKEQKNTQVKRIFIIYGWDGTSQSNWFPWLKSELSKRNFTVTIPQMPNSNAPDINKWVSHLFEVVGVADENTYFIGHSIGCQAIIRFVQELPIEEKIGGAVFVAGFFKLFDLKTEEEKQIAKPWLETPINFEKVKQNIGSTIAIFSTNDPDVPISNKDSFEKNLNSKIIIEKDKGHFADGLAELPIALNSILEIINKKKEPLKEDIGQQGISGDEFSPAVSLMKEPNEFQKLYVDRPQLPQKKCEDCGTELPPLTRELTSDLCGACAKKKEADKQGQEGPPLPAKPEESITEQGGGGGGAGAGGGAFGSPASFGSSGTIGHVKDIWKHTKPPVHPIHEYSKPFEQRFQVGDKIYYREYQFPNGDDCVYLIRIDRCMGTNSFGDSWWYDFTVLNKIRGIPMKEMPIGSKHTGWRDDGPNQPTTMFFKDKPKKEKPITEDADGGGGYVVGGPRNYGIRPPGPNITGPGIWGEDKKDINKYPYLPKKFWAEVKKFKFEPKKIGEEYLVDITREGKTLHTITAKSKEELVELGKQWVKEQIKEKNKFKNEIKKRFM